MKVHEEEGLQSVIRRVRGISGAVPGGKTCFSFGLCVCECVSSTARAVQSGGAQDGWDLRSPRGSTPRQVHVLCGWRLSSVSRRARIGVVATSRVVFWGRSSVEQPPREVNVRYVATRPRFPHSLLVLRRGNAKIDFQGKSHHFLKVTAPFTLNLGCITAQTNVVKQKNVFICPNLFIYCFF